MTGTFYQPSPPPQADSVAELRQWVLRDLQRIADVLGEGRLQGVMADVLHQLPARPQEGMMQCFAAGVAGAQAGFYEYATGTWKKL